MMGDMATHDQHVETDSRTKGRWGTVFDFSLRSIDNAQKIVVAVVVGMLVVLAAFYVCVSWRSSTTIEPIAVPKDFEAKGFTPDSTQKIFREDMLSILEAASSVMPTQIHDTLDGGVQNFNLSIPGTGMSVQEAINVAKALIRPDGQISAEIVREEKGLLLMGRVVRPGGAAHSFQVERQDDDLKALLADGAQEAMRSFSPFVRASASFRKALLDCQNHIACDYSVAADQYQSIIDPATSDPKDREKFGKWAYLGLSKVAEVNLDYLSEIENARQALRIDPAFGWAQYNWGVALEKMGCDNEAFVHYRKAVYDRGRVPENHNALGREYLKFARHIVQPKPSLQMKYAQMSEQAQLEFSTATWLDPQYAEAYFHLGESYEVENRHAEALTALKTAIGLGGDFTAQSFAEAAVVEYQNEEWDKVVATNDDASKHGAQHHPICRGNPEASVAASEHCAPSTVSPVLPPENWQVPAWPNHPFTDADCVKYSGDGWP
jgi:tetratricopeptide (TPR) repeat protein